MQGRHPGGSSNFFGVVSTRRSAEGLLFDVIDSFSLQDRVFLFERICYQVVLQYRSFRLFTQVNGHCIRVDAEGVPHLAPDPAYYVNLDEDYNAHGWELKAPMMPEFLLPAYQELLNNNRAEFLALQELNREHGLPVKDEPAWYFRPDVKLILQSLSVLGQAMFRDLYRRDDLAGGIVRYRAISFGLFPFGKVTSYPSYASDLDKRAIKHLRDLLDGLGKGVEPVFSPAARSSVDVAAKDEDPEDVSASVSLLGFSGGGGAGASG